MTATVPLLAIRISESGRRAGDTNGGEVGDLIGEYGIAFLCEDTDNLFQRACAREHPRAGRRDRFFSSVASFLRTFPPGSSTGFPEPVLPGFDASGFDASGFDAPGFTSGCGNGAGRTG